MEDKTLLTDEVKRIEARLKTLNQEMINLLDKVCCLLKEDKLAAPREVLNEINSNSRERRNLYEERERLLHELGLEEQVPQEWRDFWRQFKGVIA